VTRNGAVCLALAILGCANPPGVLETESVLNLSVVATTVLPENMFIGYPADACFGPSGEILVLDQAAAAVHVFTPEGSYMETFGSCGDGPGEMGNPMSIETVGNRILIRDQVRNGYLIFNGDHVFEGEAAYWSRSAPQDFRNAGGGRFIAVRCGIVPAENGPGLFREALIYKTGEEEPEAVLQADTVPLDPSEIASLARAKEGLLVASDTCGSCFVALTTVDSYRIHVWNGVSMEEFIDLEVQPVRKTDSEIRREEEFMTAQMNTMGAEGFTEWTAQAYRDVIRSMGVYRGELWVQNGQYEFPRFDLHSIHTGTLLHTAEFPAEGMWNFRISPSGILAWEEDPQNGMFLIHVLSVCD